MQGKALRKRGANVGESRVAREFLDVTAADAIPPEVPDEQPRECAQDDVTEAEFHRKLECSYNRSRMTPVTDVSEGVRRIEAHTGQPEEFLLPISDALLDPVGVNMAIVADAVLQRDWCPIVSSSAKGIAFTRTSTREDK
ncbi:MAG TPA: hypothetical protein VKE70_31450 [Candidatus Solibacter sp.]|nr:hypothetical protein [Candidatus Solibacter sp.]